VYRANSVYFVLCKLNFINQISVCVSLVRIKTVWILNSILHSLSRKCLTFLKIVGHWVNYLRSETVDRLTPSSSLTVSTEWTWQASCYVSLPYNTMADCSNVIQIILLSLELWVVARCYKWSSEFHGTLSQLSNCKLGSSNLFVFKSKKCWAKDREFPGSCPFADCFVSNYLRCWPHFLKK
jgi:hypothetical protein